MQYGLISRENLINSILITIEKVIKQRFGIFELWNGVTKSSYATRRHILSY